MMRLATLALAFEPLAAARAAPRCSPPTRTTQTSSRRCCCCSAAPSLRAPGATARPTCRRLPHARVRCSGRSARQRRSLGRDPCRLTTGSSSSPDVRAGPSSTTSRPSSGSAPSPTRGRVGAGLRQGATVHVGRQCSPDYPRPTHLRGAWHRYGHRPHSAAPLCPSRTSSSAPAAPATSPSSRRAQSSRLTRQSGV